MAILAVTAAAGFAGGLSTALVPGRPATAPGDQARVAHPAARSGVDGPGEHVLNAIARCESGGDPNAISPDGRYRGKYQFDRRAWRLVGGRGDPARAPEAVQDRLARKLLLRDGTQPWPVCGPAAVG